MISQEIIKQLKDYPPFQEFQAWVIEQVDNLNSLDGVDSLSVLQAGEEVKARVKAVTELQVMLAPFIDFREKREPTTEEINRAKQKAGL
jgi:hypothetical protein